MKRFVRVSVLFVAAAILAVACSKSKDSGNIILDSPALFFTTASQTGSVGFTTQNIKTISSTGKPSGWGDAVVDLTSGTITLTGPSDEDLTSGEAVYTGSYLLVGYTPGGTVVSKVLFVGVVPTVDKSGEVANSYIVAGPNINFLIDASHKSDGSELATASVEVIWQSASGLVQYVDYEEGKASFFVGADSNDETKTKMGNAVIGAYDIDGEMIWSWHVWVTTFDPESAEGSVDLNGFKMMARNLGAFANNNSKPDSILASYGLYYQWGRKDPFIGPKTYRGAEGAGATMYMANNSRAVLTMTASSAEVGTAEYAAAHPLVFITGVDDSNNDWLWSAHADNLWAGSDLAAKSVNDPCPYGWRVAPSAAFAGLTVAGQAVEGQAAAGDETQYGWKLSDGSVEDFFLGGGRRTYLFGKILNVYNPTTSTRAGDPQYAQPWEGLYWSSDALGTQASALHFWFEKLNTTSGIDDAAAYARANGLQIRCVKM